MTDTEIFIAAAEASLALFILLAGLVGLIASRRFPHGVRGPLTLIYGALTAGGLAFFLVLAVQIQIEQDCRASTTRAMLHGGYAQ